MDFLNGFRLGQGQKIVIALKLAVTGGETIAAKMLFMETQALNLRTHGAVEDQDALARRLGQCRRHFRTVRLCRRCTKKIVKGRRHKGYRLYSHCLVVMPERGRTLFASLLPELHGRA
ncbi:hypothetical protein P046_01778 [Brucella suis 06-997-1672]|nr:hypothetical protein C000_00483 [Brucella suis F7/06-1]ENT52584.1 hypothetical protein B988_00481 [Brucella suis F7/06-2]ERU16461.1 hypothetical protein P046_01778 [Brucella suis 06-997-1672]